VAPNPTQAVLNLISRASKACPTAAGAAKLSDQPHYQVSQVSAHSMMLMMMTKVVAE